MTRAIGFQPEVFARAADVTTIDAAPSLIFDAFAAVTVPSFWNAGRKVGILSKFVLNGSSSFATRTVSFFEGISTATTSSENRFCFQASCARL
ncbi:hypothetical protein D3C83_50960 [compost metagenome]